jgi:hypothetical protein
VPFTTTVSLDHFNPNNASALSLDNFSKLTYSSPGFLNNQFVVTSPSDGVWSLGGQVDSPFFPSALNGAVNFTNVKNLVIDTTRGASNDNISFETATALPTGLQRVTINTGAGSDTLSFDDSASLADGNCTPILGFGMVEPLLGGVHAGRAAELSAHSTVPDIEAGRKFWAFQKPKASAVPAVTTLISESSLKAF